MRRTTINTPKTFAELQAALVTFLETSSKAELAKGFKIVYEDDEGDLISIYNDADVQEALRQAFEAGEDRPILRLSITRVRDPATPNKKKEETAEAKKEEGAESEGKCRRFHGGCRRFQHVASGNPLGPFAELLQTAQARLPDLLSNPALRAMAEGLVGNHALKILTPYYCDNCNAQISGDRYHSTTNDDFDLCSACFNSVGERLNAEHKFNKVSALDALIGCLQNGGTFDAFFSNGPFEEAPRPHCAVCDKCDTPIVGSRFKCLDCADYDECNLCHKQGGSAHAEGHVFYEITDVTVRAVPADVRAAHDARRASEKKLAEEEAKARAAAALEKLRAEAEAKAAAEAEARRVEAEAAAAAKARAEAEAAKFVPVEAPKPVAPPAAVAAEEQPRGVSSFEANLATLESMGFDRRRSIQALVRARGSVFQAIQEMLASQ